MTGYSIDTVRNRFVNSGGLVESTGASLLQKPYTVEGVGRKVREVLDGARFESGEVSVPPDSNRAAEGDERWSA